MTSTLYWEPVKEPKKYFSDEVKFALRKKLDEEYLYGNIITVEMVPYLEGLKDAGVNGISEVIKALCKYGEIEVKEIS